MYPGKERRCHEPKGWNSMRNSEYDHQTLESLTVAPRCSCSCVTRSSNQCPQVDSVWIVELRGVLYASSIAVYTRCTVHGRGAKRRTSSEYSKRTRRNVSATSHTSVRNSESKKSVSGHGIGRKSRSLFFNMLGKSSKMKVRKGVPEPADTSS